VATGVAGHIDFMQDRFWRRLIPRWPFNMLIVGFELGLREVYGPSVRVLSRRQKSVGLPGDFSTGDDGLAAR
jgi:hypothetical protein